MLPWINEQVAETKERLQQWRMSRNINVLATVDHVEMASTHVVLGLNIGWENKTLEPITIMEIQVMVYKKKEDELLLRLLPLERFARTDILRTFQRTPLSQFDLPPKAIHTEHIRFLSHGNADVPVGTYTTDIHVTDTNHNIYVRRTHIQVENKMKYRLTEDWTEVTEKL